MIINPLALSAIHFILIGVSILAGLYFVISNLPNKNQLPIRNVKKAKAMLTEIKIMAFNKPALTFGRLRKLNCFVFEELLLLAFKQHDFTVKHNQRYTGDGGIEGTVFDSQGKKYLIQAKRYKSAINPAHVKDFALVVSQRKAHAGFFIHTGRTGQKSHENRTWNIHIISGDRLLHLLTGRDFLQ